MNSLSRLEKADKYASTSLSFSNPLFYCNLSPKFFRTSEDIKLRPIFLLDESFLTGTNLVGDYSSNCISAIGNSRFSFSCSSLSISALSSASIFSSTKSFLKYVCCSYQFFTNCTFYLSLQRSYSVFFNLFL